MTSQLRGTKRERGNGCHAEQSANGGDECPVCMAAFARGQRTEQARVAFPCGHAVCRACDVKMQERSFHSCPLCRTPREGYSQADVEQASRARSLSDELADAPLLFGELPQQDFDEFMRSEFMRPMAMAPGRVEIMRFRSEAQGDPFDVLRTLREATLRPDLAVRAHAQRTVHVQAQDLTSEEEDEVLDSDGMDRVRRFVSQSGFADLITNHLLQPTDLHTFLAQHQQVTNDMNTYRGALSGTRPARRFVLAPADHPVALTAARLLEQRP